MNVLLVEDDPQMAEWMEAFLESHGHAVTRFTDGESGWESYQRQNFQMAVLDWMLPGMDGLEVCRKIRNCKKGANTLVLIITARTNPGDLELVMAAGADDYLSKPFDSDLLKIRITIAEQRVRNLMQQRKTEAELRIAATAFETNEGMFVTDEHGVILRANSAFSEITGYTPEEVVGQTPRLLNSGRHDAEFYASMWGSVHSAGTWRGEVWNRRKSGEVYPQHLTITAVKDEGGDVTNYVASLHDITERKQVEELIFNHAYQDPLTLLPNRRLLNDRLERAMAAGKRGGLYGAVMFLDLDNFKPLNDLHGHVFGDLLLAEAAARLRACVRENDTVARFGGDEFVVMLCELGADKAQATEYAGSVANKIRTALSEPYRLINRHDEDAEKSIEHRCTASIGVALFYGDETPKDDILKHADTAMYRAKADGRNLIRFAD